MQALRDGFVNVYHGRIFLIGQEGAGKTSLKKSLTGQPFNQEERSTVGIEVDPSTFEIDVDQVKNWQYISENKQGLLGCSRGIAEVVTAKLSMNEDNMSSTSSEEDEDTQLEDEVEKDGSEEDQEINDEDEDDDDGYIDEEEEEEKAENYYMNQVCHLG